METSSITSPFPGRVSIPSSFVSLFIFYILSYLLSKMMGCFFGCLMFSASGQKLVCEVCSAFKCSFDEVVGEKVVSVSYSSAILVPSSACTLLCWVSFVQCIMCAMYFQSISLPTRVLPDSLQDFLPLPLLSSPDWEFDGFYSCG